MTLDIGVIGAGAHGSRYLRHLVRGDVSGLRAVALCRRDPVAADRLAAEFAVRRHTDPAALIDDPAVAAVIIATPPSSHFPLALAALAAGKPVLLEKPMTGHEFVLRERHDAAAPTLPAAMAAWRDAITGCAPVPVTAEDGLRTLEVVDACYRAATARTTVTIDPGVR